ncbi:hypothetical protein J6W34_00940 [bacterium]|nr:hypothetical protein [bacterium]
MANLHFHYGTMGTSKSAELIMNAYNWTKNGVKVECIKPKMDNRWAAEKINSRIGISTPAKRLVNLDDYNPQKDTKVVLIDEIQFFSPKDIDKLVKFADERNIIVICYGLLVDYNENMFPTSKRLIEVGAKLHQLKSNCQIEGCMCLSTHHLLFDGNGNVVRGGTGIQVGDSVYKSVCRKHFNEYYKGKVK